MDRTEEAHAPLARGSRARWLLSHPSPRHGCGLPAVGAGLRRWDCPGEDGAARPRWIRNGTRTTMTVMARDQSRTDEKDTRTERLQPRAGGKARQAMRDARMADPAVASLDSVTEEIDSAAGNTPEQEADTENAQADAEDTRPSAEQQQDAQDQRPFRAEAASHDERPAGIKTVEHELPTVPSTRK